MLSVCVHGLLLQFWLYSLDLSVSLSFLLFLQPLCALFRQKEALVCAGPCHLSMLLQIHSVRLQVQAA